MYVCIYVYLNIDTQNPPSIPQDHLRKLPQKDATAQVFSLSLPPCLELCTVGIKRGILCTRAILQSINDLDSQVHTDTLRIQFKKADSAGFWITWTKDVDPLRPMLCLRLRFAPLPGRFSDWHVRRNSKRWNVTREVWPCRYKPLQTWCHSVQACKVFTASLIAAITWGQNDSNIFRKQTNTVQANLLQNMQNIKQCQITMDNVDPTSSSLTLLVSSLMP